MTTTSDLRLPRTAAGKLLAEWLTAMRRKEYLGVPDPALVLQIEDEAALTSTPTTHHWDCRVPDGVECRSWRIGGSCVCRCHAIR